MFTPRQRKRIVQTPDGHQLWTGGLANGYPAGKHNGRTVYLKRLIWEDLYGPIPDGSVVTSTCGERICIEPTHLGLAAPGRYTTMRNERGRYMAEAPTPADQQG